MTDDPNTRSTTDPDLRRMMRWVFIALIVTVAAALVVVEFTLRWFGAR